MIKEIIILPKNPNKATVVKETGVIYVDYLFWSTISERARIFTVLHEQGHLELNCDCEHKADDYAKRRMLKMGFTIDEIKSAAKEILGHSRNLESSARLTAIKGTTYDIDPVSAAAVANAAADFLSNAVSFINRGKRERAAYDAAQKQLEANNATDKELALIDAKKRQDRAALVIAVTALLAGSGIAIALLRSPKYPNFVMPKALKGSFKTLQNPSKFLN